MKPIKFYPIRRDANIGGTVHDGGTSGRWSSQHETSDVYNREAVLRGTQMGGTVLKRIRFLGPRSDLIDNASILVEIPLFGLKGGMILRGSFPCFPCLRELQG